MTRSPRVVVGISGYDYPHWRGRFYPREVPRHSWFNFASARFRSIELNNTHYALGKPEHFQRWADAVDDDFVFAVKGGRYITHMKQLKDVDTALANFFASGVLLLGTKTGPFLWQLPARVQLKRERLEAFLSLLPRTSTEAARLALRHDDKVAGRAVVDAVADVPLRHALEPRHPSFFTGEAHAVLRAHDVAFVVADAAGLYPMNLQVDGDLAYVRLHGDTDLYNSAYDDAALDVWADRVAAWAAAGKDVVVYFDNDGRGHAPFDALRLHERLTRVVKAAAQPRP